MASPVKLETEPPKNRIGGVGNRIGEFEEKYTGEEEGSGDGYNTDNWKRKSERNRSASVADEIPTKSSEFHE
jgi:hypothetical protein